MKKAKFSIPMKIWIDVEVSVPYSESLADEQVEQKARELLLSKKSAYNGIKASCDNLEDQAHNRIMEGNYIEEPECDEIIED